MKLDSLLEELREDPSFVRNVAYWGVSRKKKPQFSPIPSDLHPLLNNYLKNAGIKNLYIHQAEAFKSISSGRDTVIITPTASGKTLAYNLVVLDELLKNKNSKAIYLFPTKALSQDQVKTIKDVGADNLRLFIYDGDTPSSVRQIARKEGRLIVTNPDMLHSGILPNHPKWVKIFDGLKYVVIDELHTYRGIFGSHLAHVISRLLRISRFYNSSPVIIATSATIQNPKELFTAITGREPVLIDRSGAPEGVKHYIIYNPPFVDSQQGIRRGVVLESYRVARRFIEEGHQTIIFARSRLNTELILSYLKNWIPKRRNQIAGYRGGYLPNERRTIEQGLKDRSIIGVVSTNALELGIDIGGMDVSIMAGYPGSVASFHQQAGRSGRKVGTSVAILITSNSPLDQYIASHPEYLIQKSVESVLINPKNIYILVDQVKCAAFELPFCDGENLGSEEVADVLEYLAEKNVLHREEGKYHWQERSYPAENISLRSADTGNFVIIDRTDGCRRVIGEVDRASVPVLLYENAVYIHGSNQYTVVELDWEKQVAYVEQSRVNYYTDAETKTDIKILQHNKEEDARAYRAFLSDVLVRTVAFKYKKIKFGTHENIGFGDINLPPTEMHTRAFILGFAPGLFSALERDEREKLLVSISHLLQNIAPLYVMTDPRDIGVAENLKQPVIELPSVILYDRYPGGVGLTDRLFEIKATLLVAAGERIAECECKSGCPSCVGPERYNKELVKKFFHDVITRSIYLVGQNG